MRKIFIHPSILSADFSRLGEEIRMVEAAGADGIHLDVMDGHFVPNLTIGPVVVKSIRKSSRIPYWAHLMIEKPGQFIDPFIEAGADGIFIHPETKDDIANLLSRIRQSGIRTGIAVNPETPAEALSEYLSLVDRILVMTVHPGFGGQHLLPEQLEKIRRIRRMVNPEVMIEVDGGVNEQTAADVIRAGADVLIAGHAIFSRENPGDALRVIRSRGEQGICRND